VVLPEKQRAKLGVMEEEGKRSAGKKSSGGAGIRER